MNKLLFKNILFGALVLFSLPTVAQIPLLIPYSGTMSIENEAFNGQGVFRFAIINGECITNSPGCATLWSNDDSSAQGSEPSNGVSVAITNGKYAIKLGDINYTNMTAIPLSTFTGDTNTYLRIWFDDGITGSQLLNPDRQLVSVPYAFKASVADRALAVDSLPAGSVGSAQVNQSEIQLRGNMACGNANSYIHAIDDNGNAVCAADDGSSYTASGGINIDGNNVISIANAGVSAAKLQNHAVTDAKVSDVSWSKLSGVPAGFADGVDNDTNTTYSAGNGISITGAANQINVTGVPWGNVSNIPSGFADGIDNDTNTTYTAGGGLSLNGNQFSLTNGGVTTTKISDGSVTGRKILPSYRMKSLDRSVGNSIAIYKRNLFEATNFPRHARLCLTDTYTPETDQVAFIDGTASIDSTSGYFFSPYATFTTDNGNNYTTLIDGKARWQSTVGQTWNTSSLIDTVNVNAGVSYRFAIALMTVVDGGDVSANGYGCDLRVVFYDR